MRPPEEHTPAAGYRIWVGLHSSRVPSCGRLSGTCPVCDAELANLQRQLDERGITEVAEKIDICSIITTIDPDEEYHELEGLAGPMTRGRDGKITDIPEGIIPDDMLLQGEIMPTAYLDRD